MSGPAAAAALYTTLTSGVALVAGGSVAYLLGLLGAAAMPPRHATVPLLQAGQEPRLVVLIPAHNEELVIHATLASLKAQSYPADRFEVVVMADNCSDRTAEIARKANVTVIERFNTVERGKGYALAEAMRQLLARPNPADAFCIIDADTWVAPDFLRVMASHLIARANAQGWCALQGRYGTLNPDEGWRASLMAGAFDLVNHVKPLGRDRLGLSVGLKGNGMAFTRPVLEAAPFSGRSITEDLDYGLDLLCHHGVRVGYVADAQVLAQMPTTAKQAASQRDRWEGGRYKLLRERALPLLLGGLRHGDRRQFDAGLDLVVPPLAEIAALLAVWLVLAFAGARFDWSPIWFQWAALAAFAGFVVYVLAGFKVAGAPPAAYAALLKAPGYAVWKFAGYAAKPLRRLRSTNAAKSIGNGSTEEWVRTERAAISTPNAVSTSEPEGVAAVK